MLIAAPLYTLPQADLGFVGPEKYIGPLYEKENQITNIKLDTKVKIYFGPLQGLGRGPCKLGAL